MSTKLIGSRYTFRFPDDRHGLISLIHGHLQTPVCYFYIGEALESTLLSKDRFDADSKHAGKRVQQNVIALERLRGFGLRALHLQLREQPEV
jgi:hypothetical protein